MRRLPSLLLASTVVLIAPAALADGFPSLDLRGFDPPADPASGLYLEPAASPATFDWNTALWTSYAFSQVTLRDQAMDEVSERPLEHQLSGDLVANVGFGERLAVGFDLPFIWYQGGDDPSPGAQALLGEYRLPAQALGDLKLLGKVTIIPPTNGDLGGFAMALHQRFALPTGDTSSFLGEGNIASETRVLFEYRYLALGAYGTTGIKLRGSEQRFGCADLEARAEAGEAIDLDEQCESTFGHQIPFGLGLTFRPQAIGIDDAGRWLWFVEGFGYLPAGPEAPFTNASLSMMQVGGGARVAIADFSLLGAIDAATVAGIGTAAVRGTFAFGWAPREHDQDHDGVEDDVDECPEDIKEDLDGYQDHDGCPDWDNDGDRVPDGSDQCDGPKEDLDDYQDDDGCPDPDNDSDGILDEVDACIDVPGIASDDEKQRGCPDPDPDKDGVLGDADRCPKELEDADGHADDDGCPDPDNDGDGIGDAEDACRDVAGKPSEDPATRGCPDRDGDGIVDDKDACKDDPGVASEDPLKHGCPAPPPEEKPPVRGRRPQPRR